MAKKKVLSSTEPPQEHKETGDLSNTIQTCKSRELQAATSMPLTAKRYQKTEEKEHGKSPQSIAAKRSSDIDLMRAKIVTAIIEIKTRKAYRGIEEKTLQLRIP